MQVYTIFWYHVKASFPHLCSYSACFSGHYGGLEQQRGAKSQTNGGLSPQKAAQRAKGAQLNHQEGRRENQLHHSQDRYREESARSSRTAKQSVSS